MALPDLIDDAIAEILLHLPPDEPAYLIRIGLVCKAWRCILSDPGFPLRYRDFHRTPPMLGFLHNTYDRSRGSRAETLHFVPTTAAKPFLDGNHWTVADCRHGRGLVEHPRTEEYVVWDPITGDREELLNRPVFRPETHTAAAVLCAVAGCDHRNCHGRPFKVIFLSAVNHQLVVHACVYSSRDPAWSMPVSANIPRGAGAGFDTSRGSLLIYNLPALEICNSLLMQKEDGSLGLAGMRGSSLYLWSRTTVNLDGIAGWMQWRVIELEKWLLPFDTYFYRVVVRAFAVGAGFFFVTCGGDAFMFDLKSGRVRYVTREPGEYYGTIFPFVSFYTWYTAPPTVCLFMFIFDSDL
ncbi:hypothetical protein EJB05_14271, partial [Eragrostis curvula]